MLANNNQNVRLTSMAETVFKKQLVPIENMKDQMICVIESFQIVWECEP